MLEDTLVEEDIHPNYRSHGVTDVGRVRTQNQDAFLDAGAQRLWVVADGMGGYSDGDVASRMVCEALTSVSGDGTIEAIVDNVREQMSNVNAALFEASVRPIDPVVSGSTVVIFVVRRTASAVLWAGDSRAYRLRKGKLARLTTDHTRAAELQLPEPHPETEADHTITRAVGGEDTLLLEVRRERVRTGDRFMLCSDGLIREVSDERIAELMGQGDPAQCAQALIAAALEGGARDNVTALVIDAAL